jgi:hypothetical protein
MQGKFSKNLDHLAGKSDLREVKAERKRQINFFNWMIWFEMAVIVSLIIHHSFIH